MKLKCFLANKNISFIIINYNKFKDADAFASFIELNIENFIISHKHNENKLWSIKIIGGNLELLSIYIPYVKKMDKETQKYISNWKEKLYKNYHKLYYKLLNFNKNNWNTVFIHNNFLDKPIFIEFTAHPALFIKDYINSL